MRAILLAACFAAWPAVAGPLDETRYCGTPARLANGEIRRRADVLAAFKRANPCPSTGLKSGACPGWIMDHVRPLASCGCDSVDNLQWLPVDMWKAKSRWERVVYACKASP